MIENSNNADQDSILVPAILNDEDNSVTERLNEIESDSDTLEPQEFGTYDGRIDLDNPDEIAHWAEQFQISSEQLKAAALLNGNRVSEIKKYLSI
jgi:redox-regulated HSP33 family molecular chaperone